MVQRLDPMFENGDQTLPVRFKTRGDRLFATALGTLELGVLVIEGLGERTTNGLRVLAHGEKVSAAAVEGRLSASLTLLPGAVAHAFEVFS